MMNQKSYFKFILVAITLLGISCTDSSSPTIENLELQENGVSVGENMHSILIIHRGNRDYTLTIDDENLIEATYLPHTTQFNGPAIQIEYGAYSIKGLEKGETVIRIKDNISQQEKSVSVLVTDGYITLRNDETRIEIITDNPDSEAAINARITEGQLFKEKAILTFFNRNNEKNFALADR